MEAVVGSIPDGIFNRYAWRALGMVRSGEEFSMKSGKYRVEIWDDLLMVTCGDEMEVICMDGGSYEQLHAAAHNRCDGNGCDIV